MKWKMEMEMKEIKKGREMGLIVIWSVRNNRKLKNILLINM